MSDPVLKLKTESQQQPDAKLQISNEKRLDIIFVLSPNGNTRIRFELPVLAKEDDKKNRALLYAEDWNSIEVTSISPGVTIQPLVIKNMVAPGVCDLQIDKKTADSDISLKLTLLHGKSIIPLNIEAGTCLTVTCAVSIPQWDEDGDITYAKKSEAEITIADDAKPNILKFVSDKLYVASGATVRLKWHVSNASKIIIKKEGEVNQGSLPNEGSLNFALQDTAKFQLIASSGNNESIARITVTVVPNSTIGKIEGLFNGQRVMGLYPYKDKLYALVKGGRGVALWETTDARTWIKTTLNNREPTFSYRENGKKIDIAVDYAGSPGVVYNNKLYLIGGSRYDMNFKRNEVYCFDFMSDAGWQKIKTAGQEPHPRMGHACITYDNRIWMIGGLTRSGAVNEVYTFDGKAWDKTESLCDTRCMGCAVVGSNGKLQLFGGFGEMPGHADRGLHNALQFDCNKWALLETNVHSAPYYNCLAVVWQSMNSKSKQQFVFGSYKDEKEHFFKDAVYRLTNGVDWGEVDGASLGGHDYWYNIQAALFKEVIWLCLLNTSYDEDENNNSHSTSLSYFAYVQ